MKPFFHRPSVHKALPQNHDSQTPCSRPKVFPQFQTAITNNYVDLPEATPFQHVQTQVYHPALSKPALLSMAPNKANGNKLTKTSKPKQTWKPNSPSLSLCSKTKWHYPKFKNPLQLLSRPQIPSPVCPPHFFQNSPS